MIESIVVFAGASQEIDKIFYKDMQAVGELIAKHKKRFVFGVSDFGIMGAVFAGVRRKKGKVLGITIPSLLEKQCVDASIYKPSELLVVQTLEERKKLMFLNGDAYLVLPGGWGTMDEFAECIVKMNIGLLEKKPIIFYNYKGFWEPLKQQIDLMLKAKTVSTARMQCVGFAENQDDILKTIESVYQNLHSKE